MSRLSIEAHEAFARVYAAQKHTGRASEAAGFTDDNGFMVLKRPEVKARIAELADRHLKANDITAERVMRELGRLAFARPYGLFNADGSLKPVHEMDPDTAATISGIETEVRMVTEYTEEVDLMTGEVTRRRRRVPHQLTKIKIHKKDTALVTLAKHFKIVGDEGEGINALASALADRLKGARKMGMADVVENEQLTEK